MEARDAQRLLLQALNDPARYPHPVDRVARIETHISTVLLAGDYAYKIKKPVDLGFLDFTSLQRRGFFCAEEIRLNRRLAPAIYLRRVVIAGTPTAPELDGVGEPIEYAVLMRRFPQEALLSRLLDRGELQADSMDALAWRIAAFHAEAAVAAASTDFAVPERVAEAVLENFDALAQWDGAQTQATLSELRQYAEQAIAALAPKFHRRREGGFVRECHGDLHLANILLWQGAFAIFDGIEFDPNLRWIDTLSDLAFTIMDLDYRGAARHAAVLKNAYLEASGDYRGVVVLRFYQSYRAMVRAKVAALRAQQLPRGESRTKAEREVTEYVALALAYSRPRRPRLVITCGLSGSGKSTAARHLVEIAGLVRLRSDVERKRLHELAPAARSHSALGAGLYTAEATEATYDRLAALARELLDAGESVVVDAAFLTRAQREPFRALAAAAGVPFAIIQTVADPGVLEERIRSRQALGTDASEADLAVLERQRQTVIWPTAGEGAVIRFATDCADWNERLREGLEL